MGQSSLTGTRLKKKKEEKIGNCTEDDHDEFYDAANEQSGHEVESSRRSSFDGFLRDNAHEAFVTVGKAHD